MIKFLPLIKNKPERLLYLPQIAKLIRRYSDKLFDDYSVMRDNFSIKSTDDFIEEFAPYFWAIVSNLDEEFMGFIYLYDFVGNENWNGGGLHSACVSTCFLRKFWGKVPLAAAEVFLPYVFVKLGLKKLKSEVFAHNHLVKKLLHKIGFEKEAVLENETLFNGNPAAIELYRIISPFC